MESLLTFIQAHLHLAPFLIYFLLCLSGLGIPVSEDALVACVALMSLKHPDLVLSLVLSLYLGIVSADLISYGLGRRFGPKLLAMPKTDKFLGPAKFNQLSKFFKRFGVFTLIVGRLIPFGFRTAMFVTAGMVQMPFKKFLLADCLAALISTSVYFSLVYFNGEDIFRAIQKYGRVGLWAIITLLILRRIFIITRKWANKGKVQGQNLGDQYGQ